MIGKRGGPFFLLVTRYMVGGGQTGQRGGTHGDAVPLPFAPRGTAVSRFDVGYLGASNEPLRRGQITY